ncbi:hypothetical protein NUW58_g4925 [Xylaria curta]|uniref:Uncharacterized protein n=1 Tax=Xylaria curta TaxID=42375 RepID=A0ACC1P771_9PEZI|nr:hypothetical protein NUW58_g4925 [Xylaria curta]
MSLNGLDDVKVKEAHDAANTEPSGWFLLKYASRDEIDVFETGSGGISDIRNAIANYVRRFGSVRAAVHFNAICDHFAHNATFEISDAKDLKDSKLSAACSLHAASGSSSSSTSSLRRRRLNEIVEEEEEEERERKRKSVVKEEERPTSSIYSDPPALPSSSEPPVVLSRQQITDPLETAFASTKNVPDFTGADAPVSPTKSEFDRRLSTQSSRYEGYSSTSYAQGRKVKLGPRPSTEAHKRRSSSENVRPVAALPAGFKFFKGSRKGKSQERGQSEKMDYAPPTTPLLPRPLSPSTDDQLPQRPATSSGASIKSTTPSTREGKLTPEKARLMKAMKLREKKLQDAKLELLSPTKNVFSANDTTKAAPDAEPNKLPSAQDDGACPTASNTDGMDNLPTFPTMKPETHSRDNVLDSHPSSPGADSSTGIGDSTKASSLSDLTDETIQASKVPAHADEEDKESVEHPDAMKDSSLQRSALDMQKNPTTEAAHTSEFETLVTGVSNGEFTKSSEESVRIPESNPNNLQSADQSAVGLEDNHNTPEKQLEIPTPKLTSGEPKSPTSSISPTTPSLKSKFSRKDIAVPTETTLDQTAPSPSVLARESPKPRVPLKAGPEILLASSSNPSRQKGSVEPIRTDLLVKGAYQIEPSDPLDDDALMDELQTATVQEAKPITVSKSPITPVFPNSGSPPRRDARLLPRAVSNPMRNSLLMPVDLSQSNTPRSASSGGAVYLNNLTRNPSNASIQSKKGNVGSSISQRIKALEALSGNPNEDRPRPTTPSSTFFTVRKQSTRDAPKSPSVVDRASSLTRQSPGSEDSREPAPEASNSKRERSGSVASKLTMFEGQNPPRGRPESIQVTARIIRGATSPFANLTNSSKKVGDAAPAEFRQSTLLVDIQRAQSMAPNALSERPAIAERPKTSVSELQEPPSSSDTVDQQARRRSSMSLMKSFIKEHTSLSNKSTENVAPPTVSSSKRYRLCTTTIYFKPSVVYHSRGRQ